MCENCECMNPIKDVDDKKSEPHNHDKKDHHHHDEKDEDTQSSPEK